MDYLKKNWKRHLISALITFVSGFVFAISPYVMQINEYNMSLAFMIGLLAAGFRGGIKLMWELAVLPLSKKALSSVKNEKD